MHITSQFRKSSTQPDFVIDNAVVKTLTSAKNLGVTLDSTLKMHHHIQKVCRAASFGIHKIGKIRTLFD